VTLIFGTLPYDAAQPNIPFQSTHNLLELGFKVFPMLGNPKFAACQKKEKFHQRAKRAANHLNPCEEPCTTVVLSAQVQNHELLYELSGGRWSEQGDIDCAGSLGASQEMQSLIRSHHFLVREMNSIAVPHRSAVHYMQLSNKTVLATGKVKQIQRLSPDFISFVMERYVNEGLLLPDDPCIGL